MTKPEENQKDKGADTAVIARLAAHQAKHWKLPRPGFWFRLQVWFSDEAERFVDEWHEGAKAYWMPVAFALGVLTYLNLPREPVFWVVLLLTGLFGDVQQTCRRALCFARPPLGQHCFWRV